MKNLIAVIDAIKAYFFIKANFAASINIRTDLMPSSKKQKLINIVRIMRFWAI